MRPQDLYKRVFPIASWTDGPTDGPTNGPTHYGPESALDDAFDVPAVSFHYRTPQRAEIVSMK